MKLGECLVFYLRYYPEMTKLYEEEEEVASLPEPVDTKEKASKVGKAADTEAAVFLEECGKIVVSHFSKIGNPRIAIDTPTVKKSDCEKDWSTAYRVWPRNRNRSDKLQVGISLVGMELAKPEVVPWIGRTDDERVQHKLVNYLTKVGKAKGTWTEVTGLPEGAVALERIRLEVPAQGFDLECDKILRDVQTAIETIDGNDLDQLFS